MVTLIYDIHFTYSADFANASHLRYLAIMVTLNYDIRTSMVILFYDISCTKYNC